MPFRCSESQAGRLRNRSAGGMAGKIGKSGTGWTDVPVSRLGREYRWTAERTCRSTSTCGPPSDFNASSRRAFALQLFLENLSCEQREDVNGSRSTG